MSYDLYFCWQRKAPIDFNLVAEWAKKHIYFQRKELQLWYNNEHTGVYFSLDFEIRDLEDAVIPEDYPDYFDSGLSFNLNYNRPSFFGYEAMPIVVDLYQSLGLTVYDPQAFEERALNQDPGAEGLINSWLRSNSNGITTLRDMGSSLPRMALSSSRYLWMYSRRKVELQTKLGDSIFVPMLFPFRKTGSADVGTAIVCTSGIPMIVPAADWVIIRRPRRDFLGFGEEIETGVISRKTFNHMVGVHLTHFPHWEPAVKIVNPETTPLVEKQLRTIEHVLPLDEFERLGTDSFTDLEDGTTDASSSVSVH